MVTLYGWAENKLAKSESALVAQDSSQVCVQGSQNNVSQNNVSLSNHDMIQGIEAQVKGRNDPSNDINAEQHKIPSDTYHERVRPNFFF